MNRPDLSVVIVHHRGQDHLIEALDALAASSGISFETILVDNTAGRPMEDVLRRHPNLRRVVAGRNTGFARGCRLGAEASRAPLLAFVNDDAAVLPDALGHLAAALSVAAPDVVAAAGRLVDASGRKNDFSDGFLTFDGHAFQSDVGRPVEAVPEAVPGEERLFACGGLMSVRRDAFLESGGFDDDYFAYLEDVDFGWRQWIFGRRVIAEPRAVARHRGGSTGEALGVFSRGFLFEKNAFATAYKNFDAEYFRDFMPAVLAAFVIRISEMLDSRNPGAAELKRDPYETASPEPSFARRLFGIRAAGAAGRVSVDDPLTVAHLRALLWIHRNHAALASKRRAVQAGRRRPDAEIFRRFPLRIVPTYPGDERLDSDFFREFLSRAPALVRATLAEIFA
jgi:GT2 family glycosyltransferase